MNGSHRQHGLMSLWGKGVRAGVSVEAGLQDLAPTLLHLMGEAIPQHMDGRVLSEALLGGGEGTRAPWSGGEVVERPTHRDEEAAIRERLERLGYL